jgi:hypothetical protein
MFFYRFELPEVPSCYRNEYSIEEEKQKIQNYSDPSGFKGDTLPGWHFPNILHKSKVNLFKFKCN